VFIKFEIKFLIIKPKTKRKCRLLGLSFHNVARHRVFVDILDAHVLYF
jgi:predicted aldo/keto reductase-like oxidoreductase